MASIPIILTGDNLGKRHQHINSLVNDAFRDKVPFESVRNLPEKTPVDRLFKIDLASKYKNNDYITQCLKNQDMLYVSRALKYLPILLEMDDFSPHYLEDDLYPYMLTIATNKMKHLISLHLKDTDKCRQFYEYYKEKNMRYALNFFPKCSSEFIMNNLEAIPFSNITPRFVKQLCENTTSATELLLKSLKAKNIELQEGRYRNSRESFMAQLKVLLKTDTNQFFFLIENFYESRLKRFNRKTTKFIMRHHRHRFEAKPELYASRFLDLPTLSRYLNNDQIKELVMQLAKAGFLGNFSCNYKFAEPLLKRMDKKEKPDFCKKIFEDNDYGEIINTPPYFIPSTEHNIELIVPKRYDLSLEREVGDFRSMLKKRKLHKKVGCFARYTKLDKLFDQYRFKAFDKTFADFKKLIPKESDLENRQNMFLVLISKTGGRAEHLSGLMEFLVQKHANEPVSLRATIVRSLMKRACAWRMVPEVWEQLFHFGHDLGLDGSDPVAPCNEGLHGVVIREILRDGQLSPSISTVYLRDFIPLSNYSLTSHEKSKLVPCLVTILLNNAKANIGALTKRFNQILDTLDAYKLQLKQFPEVISSIKDGVSHNPSSYREILERLFKLNVGRQMFFKENFALRQTDESYLNALKMDVDVLKCGEHFEKLLDQNGAKQLRGFLRKVAVYFIEEDGLATTYLAATKRKVTEEYPKLSLVRTMALLAGSTEETQELLSLLENGDSKLPKSFSASLWANIHLVRPRSFTAFSEIKGKSYVATANYIQTCSPVLLKDNMEIMLTDPKLARQVLALRGPLNIGLIAKTLHRAGANRHTKALQIALRILRKYSHVYQEEDWNAFKILVDSKILEKKKAGFYLNIAKIDAIPEKYKLEYCLMIYDALARANLGSDDGPSYRMLSSILPYLFDNLNKADGLRICSMITAFIESHFSVNKLTSANYEYSNYVENFVRIAAKFILLSNSATEHQRRVNDAARPFLDRLKQGWTNDEKLQGILTTFLEPITDLKQSFRANNELMDLLINFYDEVMPLEENFRMNINMRFTIFLIMSIEQCILEDPKLFEIEYINREDCMKLLGISFAKILIAYLDDIIIKYSDSIVAIYSEELHSFVYNLKYKWNNKTWDQFMMSLVKTLLEGPAIFFGPLLGTLLYCKMGYENNDITDSLKAIISKIDDIRIRILFADINY